MHGSVSSLPNPFANGLDLQNSLYALTQGQPSPIFQPPNEPVVLSLPTTKLLEEVHRYYDALAICQSQGIFALNDTTQLLPVDPILKDALDGRGRVHVLKDTHFTTPGPPPQEIATNGVRFIMRASALTQFQQMVDDYALKHSHLVGGLPAIAALHCGAIDRNQRHLPIHGPQGMGKSYAMAYDVTVRRSALATNRVIFIPDCGVWARTNDPLAYLIRCLLVAFHHDHPVIAACKQVSQLSHPLADDHTATTAVTNLLSYCAMYCQINGFRLYLYADGVNELVGDENRLDQFPFSIVASRTTVPYWSVFGVVIITAALSTHQIIRHLHWEERHFSLESKLFLSRYTPSESDEFLQGLIQDRIIHLPLPKAKEVYVDYTGLNPLECSLLAEYIREQHKHEAVGSGGVIEPYSPGNWLSLLDVWKTERLKEFDAMFTAYDRKNPFFSELEKGRLERGARALEFGLPITSVAYDPRLIFVRRGKVEWKEDTYQRYLEALSHLVRIQLIRHYPNKPITKGPKVNLVTIIKDALNTLLCCCRMNE